MKSRRQLSIVLAAWVLLCGALSNAYAATTPPEYPSTTYTYKKVGNLPIQLDVYRPQDDVVRPVVLWIHGGALMMGSRHDVLRGVTDPLIQAGYAVVSIDYRLAPETKLPDIIEDIQDAYEFVRVKGPGLFKVRANKIAVMGNSAGGYLSLMLGFKGKPRPAAVVSFYGYGDLLGSWYSEPSAHYRTTSPLISEADARSVVGHEPIADGSLSKQPRYKFYFYTRQNGLWLQEAAGLDAHSPLRKFAPFLPIRHVTRSYPPTMLIHGDVDTDVPYEQSVMMAHELQAHKVPHELITIKNADHFLNNGDEEAIKKAYADAVQFVIRYTR